MKVLDLLITVVGFCLGAAGLAFVAYLFITVVYLGESSSCPLNSC